MTILVAVASIVVFVLALSRSGLVTVCAGVVSEARQAIRALRDAELDDLEKERFARRAAGRLFRFSLAILLRGFLVVAISLVPIVLADLVDLAPAEAVLRWMMRPDVIVAATVVLVGAYLARTYLWPRT